MTTWVLLRGLTRERRHWGDVVERFEHAFPDATVLAPDLPGNGARVDLRSPACVTTMVEVLRQEVLMCGRAPPYRVFAMSLGAMVAVEWASRYPREVAAAVLVNTSLAPFDPFWRRLRPRCYAPLVASLAAGDRAREATVLALTSNVARHDPARRAALLDAWTAWRAERRVRVGNAGRQLIAAARYRAPGRRPDVPLLVLAGACDRLVHPTCSRGLAARWATDFALHPRAGHDLPLDDASWVVETVRTWAADLGSTGRANPST